MNSATSLNPPASSELEPWVIVTHSGTGEVTSQLAVWRIDGEQSQAALALFSERPLAERYAQQFCAPAAIPPPASPPAAAASRAMAPAAYRIEQFTPLQLVAVLAECYRLGMRCAALNPGRESAQQLFVLRDVLAAAKQRLSSGTGLN